MRINDLYKKYTECGGKVSTDSRAIRGGEMFFALKGENFDGNAYALKALDAGAKYAVVSRDAAVAHLPKGSTDDIRSRDAAGKERLIPVDDPLKALQELATHHRKVCFCKGEPLKVIALTGTNGKTTTKELIRAVLATKYNVAATQGNLNNSIGVPLTLLGIDTETQIAVVEMGASHPGDIDELTSIALPDYGLVTNVGKAHLLGFGSLEGVMKAKGELYDYILRDGDKVFLNADNLTLCRMVSARPKLKIVRYGTQFYGASVLPLSEAHPFLRISFPGGRILETKLAGAYNADNVMAAIAVGREFDIDEADAIKAIEAYTPSNSRSQIIRTESNTLIVDAYNANPTSMEAALASLDVDMSEAKAVMLGNMLELGRDSVGEHVKVIERLGKINGLDTVVLVGEEFRKALEQCRPYCVVPQDEDDKVAEEQEKALKEATFRWFATSDEAAAYLREHPVTGHCILIKGSRGSRMENVIPAL